MSLVIIGPDGQSELNQSNSDNEATGENKRDGEQEYEIPDGETIPGLEIITPTQPQQEKAPIIFPLNISRIKPRVNEILGDN